MFLCKEEVEMTQIAMNAMNQVSVRKRRNKYIRMMVTEESFSSSLSGGSSSSSGTPSVLENLE
jgi:hypothetical protein